jgi:tetratricopeptide (TPR) repeat protein
MRGGRTLKKYLLITFGILLFVTGVYASVWYESYQRSKTFFDQASQSFANGDYGRALKGGESFDENTQSYKFVGGYEQVVGIWTNRWAVPKPGIYREAEAKIHDILYEKLTADQGLVIFKKYLNLSNAHLPEILIQSGKLYKQKGEIEKAREIFQLAIEAFGMDENIKREAERQLHDL